jgi:DNA-binding transcriptional ArsR family regulator
MDSSPALLATDPVHAAAGARFFRVLGDATRLRILELLLERPRTVSELAAAAGVPRARVSNHLACLRWCGFATTERRGRQVLYRAADPRLAGLLAAARPLVEDNAAHLAGCQRIGPDWI